MDYLGDFAAGDTVDLKFTTVNSSGVPTTLAGSPAVSVYKGDGTTESTAGVTLTVDFDGRTGMHHVRITTVSDGTFYAAANEFQIVITAGTVGGSSVVGYVVGAFSIGNRGANVTKWLGAAPNALQSGRVDSYLGAAAAGVLAAANFAAGALDAVWSTTTRLLTAGTNIVLAKGTGVTGFNDLDAAGIRSAVGLASDNLDAQLGAIDDLLDTEIAAIKTDTAAIKTKTDNLPTDPADESSIQAAVAAVSAFVDTEVGAVKAVTDKLDTALELDGSEYRFTTNALEQATPGSGPSAADIADAVWDESITGHSGVSTFGGGVRVLSFSQTAAIQAGHLGGFTVDSPSTASSVTVVGDLTGAEGCLATWYDIVRANETRVITGVVYNSGTGKSTFTVDRPFSSDPLDTGHSIYVRHDAATPLDSSLGVAVSEDALLDLPDGVESGVTLRQALRGIVAVLLGKASGMAGTTATFRDTNDTKDRVTATVDSSGNRTAVSTDLT